MNTADIRMLAPQVRATALWMLLVPILVGALVAAVLGAPEWRVLALGAGGWIIALLLRQPVMLIANRTTSPERARTIVGWASGPAEELVRVGMVLLFVKTVSNAVWAGVGWAGGVIGAAATAGAAFTGGPLGLPASVVVRSGIFGVAMPRAATSGETAPALR